MDAKRDGNRKKEEGFVLIKCPRGHIAYAIPFNHHTSCKGKAMVWMGFVLQGSYVESLVPVW
jgi:hypothetical protein